MHFPIKQTFRHFQIVYYLVQSFHCKLLAPFQAFAKFWLNFLTCVELFLVFLNIIFHEYQLQKICNICRSLLLFRENCSRPYDTSVNKCEFFFIFSKKKIMFIIHGKFGLKSQSSY